MNVLALRGPLSPFDNGKFDSKKNKKGKNAVIFSVAYFASGFVPSDNEITHGRSLFVRCGKCVQNNI